MQIDLIIEDERWQEDWLFALSLQAARATLGHLGLDPASFEMAVLACDDLRIASLNQEFRGKQTPTNVLSWPSEDLSPKTEGEIPQLPLIQNGEHHLGDIAISLDTCLHEAEAVGKPLGAHVTHLIVHALLHLLGYDHIRDADATVMETLEVAILGKLGHENPYMLDI